MNINNGHTEENAQQLKAIEFELSLQCTKCGVDFRKLFKSDDTLRLQCPHCSRLLCTITPIVGIVYVLSNSSMPDLLKIGYTIRPIAERLQELSTTGVPLPFDVEAVYSSSQPLKDENIIHDALKEYRLSGNREFFQLTSAKAVELISRVLRRAPIGGVHCSLSQEI